jgi:hypothetical protein
MSEDTGSCTEADAGAYEQERGAGLVPVICGSPTGPSAECSCVLPLNPRHEWHECRHLRDYLRDVRNGQI